MRDIKIRDKEMLYKDVDKRLDMAFSISTEIKNSILPLIEKDYGRLPVYVHVVNGKIYMDIYLVINRNEKFGTRTSIYQSIIREPYQIIRMEMNEIPGSSLLAEDLFRVPSLIISHLYIENGRMYGRIRFHHSDLHEVNKIISKLTESQNSRLEDLGPSRGGIWELNRLNRFLPLSVLSYDQDLPDEWKFTSGMETFTELKPQKSVDKSFQLIFYGGNGVSSIPGKIISDDPSISLVTGTSDIADQLWHESNLNFVSRIAILAKQFEGVARTVIILPTILAGDQLAILSRIGKNYENTNFRITAFRTYSEEVWEWI